MYKRIRDFQLQDEVTTTLAVVNKQTRTTKQGNPYLHLDLQDRTGKISCKVWDETKSSIPWDDIISGQVYLFSGKVEEFQEKLQMIISDITEVDSYAKEDFIAKIDESVDDLKSELFSYIDLIEDVHVKKLVEYFFTDASFIEKFCEMPAARAVHDSKIGGLLRHTVRVLRLALYVYENYTECQIQKDLLIAGIVFHDMEKVTEFSIEGPTIEYTDLGHYVGHCSLAMLRVYEATKKIDNFPEDLRSKILHIIAAHAAEYDPIRLPGTMEALVVHLCDLLDSQVVHFDQEWEKNLGNGWKKDYLTDRWCYYPEKKKE